MAIDKLTRLGYDLPRQPPAPEVLLELEKIMRKLENRNRWLLLVSNRPSMLKALAQIVPITYALTHKRAVHNISPQDLYELYINGKEQEICPLGIDSLEYTNLVWFEQFGDALAEMYKLQARLSRLFSIWCEPYTSVVLSHCYPFRYKPDKLLKTIARHYGDSIVAYVNEKADVLDIH
jgi:hypothetical protein